jgi:hypothetical protein
MMRKIFGRKKVNKCGFGDIIDFIDNKTKNTILINTLSSSEQNLLIKKTTTHDVEEQVINDAFKQGYKTKIIIYGKNNFDEKVDEKYFQLINLGYLEENVYVYYGGLFEWCLLQDIYDVANFPTTNKCVDILHFGSKT